MHYYNTKVKKDNLNTLLLLRHLHIQSAKNLQNATEYSKNIDQIIFGTLKDYSDILFPFSEEDLDESGIANLRKQYEAYMKYLNSKKNKEEENQVDDGGRSKS